MFSGARFFVDNQPLAGSITLSREDSRHIAAVLRGNIGDFITVCDGSGKEAACRLTSSKSDYATAEVVRVRDCLGEPFVHTHLFPSLAKGERFEWMLQKCVELGACEITPVISQRCIVRKAAENKLTRWRRILMEAAKQSGRGCLTTLNSPIPFNDAVLIPNIGEKIFCYEKESDLPLQNIINCCTMKHISVLTGPEGGYTEAEAQFAVDNGWHSVTLGNRILRCETAPLAVLSLIQFIFPSTSPTNCLEVNYGRS